jgi:hypothetical protein
MTNILFYVAVYYSVVSTIMIIMCLCFMPILLHHHRSQRLRLRVHWIWFDFWIGLYYDAKKRVVWFAPFPMLMFRIWPEDKP